MTLNCPYCGEKAVLIDSAEVYRGTSYGPIWICRPCKAWVGCHAGTVHPLGRLANGKLRRLKMDVHRLFDPLWKEKKISRKDAYRWLALALEIEFKRCHIGNFDEDMCERAIKLIKAREVSDGIST